MAEQVEHYRCVLLDICVQSDLFETDGSCWTPAAPKAAGNVRRLFAWARRLRVPVISTVLRVRPGRTGPLAAVPHCLEGSPGERRLAGTLLDDCIDLGMRHTTDLPRDIFRHYQQVVFEMRFTDIFAHPRAERLLTELRTDAFIVCGAGTARGVVEAVIGLRARGVGVILAADAILDLGDPAAGYAWLRMLAKGALAMSTEQIVSRLSPPAGRRPAGRRRRGATGRALTG